MFSALGAKHWLFLTMIFFVDFFQVFVGVVGVDLRGSDVGVPEHHLDRADVGAVLQKIGGE